MKPTDNDHQGAHPFEDPADPTMREAFEQLIQREHPDGPAPGPRTRHYRFGISMLVLAVFTAVSGAYPLLPDTVWRAMFLTFSVVLAFIGAYFVDRSNRVPQRWKSLDAPPASAEPSRPRRVK